jgi:transposase
MSKALSVDLRVRLLAAVAEGLTHRQAGERFGVSAASVSRWWRLARVQGDARPGPLGGDRRSQALERHGATLLEIVAANRDITLAEIRTALEAKGVRISIAALWRFLDGTGSRSKKSAHANEQSHPEILKRRQDWFESQPDLDPERLIFIDETWASTNMARRHGRCLRGERLRMAVPHGHWKTTTFVGALTLRGFIAPWRGLDGPINRDAFETYVDKALVPEQRPGYTVVMDNLSSHKGPKVRKMIEAAGAELCYLPPYSPDFNLIEMAFAKPKALLRKAAERTVDGLWNAIGRIIDLFELAECENYFTAVGYDAT